MLSFTVDSILAKDNDHCKSFNNFKKIGKINFTAEQKVTNTSIQIQSPSRSNMFPTASPAQKCIYKQQNTSRLSLKNQKNESSRTSYSSNENGESNSKKETKSHPREPGQEEKQQPEEISRGHQRLLGISGYGTAITNDQHFGCIAVSLEKAWLWDVFRKVGTEMVITKSGRYKFFFHFKFFFFNSSFRLGSVKIFYTIDTF